MKKNPFFLIFSIGVLGVLAGVIIAKLIVPAPRPLNQDSITSSCPVSASTNAAQFANEAKLVPFDTSCEDNDVQSTKNSNGDLQFSYNQIKAYAEEFGVSEQEALRRLQFEEEAFDAIEDILETEGIEHIAGWGVEHGENITAWILLVDNGLKSSSVQTIKHKAPYLDIRYGATYSAKQLESEHGKIQSHLYEESVPSEKNMINLVSYTDIDIYNNQLVIGVKNDVASGLTDEQLIVYAENYFSTLVSTKIRVEISENVELDINTD